MSATIKLGLITMTRGTERAAFVEQAERLIYKQMYQPYKWYLINYKPRGDYFDIVERVRVGLDRALTDGITHLAFWEDDDYYRADYLSNMVNHLDGIDMLGSSFLPMYHLRIRRWGLEYHGGTPSISLHRTIASTRFLHNALSEYVLPAKQAERVKFLDGVLWAQARRDGLTCKVVNTELFDCVTMKHGVGKCGMHCHTGVDYDHIFQYPDPDMHWLSRFTGDDFEFYKEQSHILNGESQGVL